VQSYNFFLFLCNLLYTLEFDSPRQQYEKYRRNYEESHLGKCDKNIPWSELMKSLRPRRKDSRGRKGTFSLRAKLGLMFLKSYTNLSDSDLFDRLHSDIHFQMFCDVYISPDQKLKDFKIISEVRVELSKKCDWDKFQKKLVEHWKPNMEQTNMAMTDATCYETDMRYPTDVKLLWESCEWLYNHIKKLTKVNKLRMPRSKYAEQKVKYLTYQKSRKKTYAKTKSRKRSLLYLLDKLIGQMNEILQAYKTHNIVCQRFINRYETIQNLLIQQQELMEGKEVKNRIVSIDKSYIRPIVRGKEVKRVEFGAKVNMLQVAGINIIEKLSFDAFNEGTRLKSTIKLSEELFGKCTHVAADAIYATNENRTYTSSRKITTSFTRKGKAGKNEEQRQKMQNLLSTHRATRMEGSFGNEKNAYGLHRIRARSAPTEVLWIYFGVHMANVSKMVSKTQNSQTQITAA
jgi:IS5 family transposase